VGLLIFKKGYVILGMFGQKLVSSLPDFFAILQKFINKLLKVKSGQFEVGQACLNLNFLMLPTTGRCQLEKQRIQLQFLPKRL